MRKRSHGDCCRIRPPAGSHGNARQRVHPTPASLRPGYSDQSTISTQLSTLKIRLGHHLCERDRSGLRFTACGERFADSARKLLGTLDVFNAEARKAGRTLVGMLDLGLVGHASINTNTRINQAIRRFQEHDESVYLVVSMCPPGESGGLLLDNRIHTAIGYSWYRVSALDYTATFRET